MGDVAFRCPTCRARLEEVEGGMACSAGHRFDRAREGYVHLLPAGRRKPSSPAGDDENMVRARRAFLDAGHYRPVIDAVADAAAATAGATHVLDAGCGEGSYLAAVTTATGATGWGVDVSKAAVRLAARRHGRDGHRYAVASSYVLPFDDAGFATVLSVFAPRPFPELFRVLAPGGSVVAAGPGPDHLAGLRALLYAEPRPHEARPHAAGEGRRVRYELTLDDPVDVRNLLQMTPYWWQARPDQQEAAGSRGLKTTVDVVVTTHPVP